METNTEYNEGTMLEPEIRNMPYADPPMDTPRPSSNKTLGISHVLASIFKDLYAKDIMRGTLPNCVKPGSGGSSYHNGYLEELQQIRSDYDKSIKEADMLENHIIQANIQAEAAEKEAYERIKESTGNVSDDQGQFGFLVKSAFSWCVDSNLLKQHDLISPLDYLPVENTHMEPVSVAQDPARHTICHTMHVNQDGGHSQILEPLVSDLSQTLESCSGAEKRKKTQKKIKRTKPRPALMDEQIEDQEKLRMLKDRQGFLRNPRFVPLNAQQGATSLLQPRNRATNVTSESSPDAPVPVFLAEPAAVVFTDYTVGQVYEMTLELKNVTSVSQHVRVLPPTTSFFSVGLGRFPGDGGMVAPGMSCKYTIRFAPDSLGDYEDFVMVEMHMENLLVPIMAERPPPVLTLPKVLDCGYCLVGGVKFVEFQCKNVGLSTGSFCIIPKNQWPVSNLRSVARTHFTEQAPFAVSPSLFNLKPGETVAVEVVFFPTAAERSSQGFTVVCDNCQVKDITVEGEGQLIAVEFVPSSENTELPLLGEARDLTAEHFVRFSPCHPHTAQQEHFIIRNNTHVELPFHWRIMKPNLRHLLPGESPEPSHIQFHLATDDAFQVRPPAGVLAPCHEEEFLLTFCPKELRDYHSVCHLVLNDVPQPQPQPSDSSGSLQPLQAGTKVSDVVALEIEVKGSTEPYRVLLEPCAVVITGEIFISTKTRRRFMMWNHSRTCVSFQWERTSSSSHTIEIEPPTGRIAENSHFDFDLIVTGLKPACVETSVVCHITHHPKPVILAVMVTFKGPVVTPSVPSVDFGLVELGGRAQTSVTLTNITHLKATWALREREDPQDSQLSVKPCRGVLPPMASHTIDVAFSARFCQKYDTKLEFAVVDGAEFLVSVRAVVQSPRLRLLDQELRLPELHLGVPTTARVTLLNSSTFLPLRFSWKSHLQGKQAELCEATFDPSSGTLEPDSRLEVMVNFTSHTDLELTEVTALCEVQGTNSPLVLHLLAPKPKKLSVAYSLPDISSAPVDESLQTVSLDFGDNVKLTSTVKKQLLITNLTAIPAPFTIEVQYFSCNTSKTKEQLEKRCFQKPLCSIQAEKLEERAHNEFVRNLLAHGKGAAFLVLPHTGILGPFETRPVDVTAYTDMWGEYRDFLICKVGELEDTLIPMQITVKGCPIYFQMTGPRPDDQNRGPVIRFGTHVCGGDTVSRSLRINNPTMFDIRLDWETYNIDLNQRRPAGEPVTHGDAPSPGHADDSEAVSVSEERATAAPEGNDAPHSDGPAPKETGEEGGGEEESVAAGAEGNETPAQQSSAAVNTETPTVEGEGKESGSPVSPGQVRPHVGTMSDYPYCITPQQAVIPARGSATVHASFTPLTLSESACETRCVGLALGFMSLDSEVAACVPGKVLRAQGVDLEPVRVDLLAVVKPPLLSVLMEDDEETLEFHAWAGDLLRGRSETEMLLRDFDVKQTLQLTNNIGTTVHFTLGTLPPFSVLRPRHLVQTSNSSYPSTGEGQYLVLQAKHNVQVKVVFHCTPSLLDYAEWSGEDLPAGVSLIQSEDGQKKLMFEQNLLIHYSNNSQQSVPLCAHLVLPKMSLSTDSIHFGSCYVGQMLTREVRLRSHGGHTSWKSAIESEDSDVFKVAPGFGFLGSKEASTIEISFTPSGEREFRAALVILSPLVKTTLTLQLQGTGSFNEVHRTDNLA